jgi:uncharacterized membrane protein YuzA (DUF378 family)
MDSIVKKIYAIAILFLIVGGIAWGWMGMMGKNPVSQAMGKYAWIVYGTVGISALLVLLVGRNAFLPFLGPTVFPCAVIADKVPENADTTVEVLVRPGAKVLYWGAEPDNEGLRRLRTWKEAYGRYNNVGVATADDMGRAVLKLRKPQSYKVPMKGSIESHVHYRICTNDGWLSQVETYMISAEPLSNPVSVTEEPTTPTPEPPLRPVTQTPDMPVVADPVTGLPTAVPGHSAPFMHEVGAELPSPVEGFSNEPLYSKTEMPAPSGILSTIQSVDPRLERLRTSVETSAIQIVDDMANSKPKGFGGTDLETAFQPIRPTSAHTARINI